MNGNLSLDRNPGFGSAPAPSLMPAQGIWTCPTASPGRIAWKKTPRLFFPSGEGPLAWPLIAEAKPFAQAVRCWRTFWVSVRARCLSTDVGGYGVEERQSIRRAGNRFQGCGRVVRCKKWQHEAEMGSAPSSRHH